MDCYKPLTPEEKEYTVIAHAIMQITTLCVCDPRLVVDRHVGYLWSEDEGEAIKDILTKLVGDDAQ